MTINEFDVCIIGSGPAGAAVAKALTGSGLKTVILEKQKLPRYKMCSGMLFPEAQAIIHRTFGEIPENVLSTPRTFGGIRIYPTKDTPPDKPVEVHMPSPLFSKEPGLANYLLNVSRAGLDYWLCTQSDATLLDNCTIRKLIKKNGKIEIGIERESDNIEIHARYLVGADGGQSMVRKKFFSDDSKPIAQIPAYEEHYTGSVNLDTEQWFYAFLDPEFSQGFASFHQKDNRLIAVTGVLEGRLLKSYFDKFRAHLEQAHGLVVKEHVHSCGIILTDMCFRGDFRLGEDTVLLCGEAAGFMRFFTEGITTALITGLKAGESILKHAKAGGNLIEMYAEAVAPEIKVVTEQHMQYASVIASMT